MQEDLKPGANIASIDRKLCLRAFIKRLVVEITDWHLLIYPRDGLDIIVAVGVCVPKRANSASESFNSSDIEEIDQKISSRQTSYSAQCNNAHQSGAMARRKSTLADDLVLFPWWVSLVLAGLAFIFLPALLPQPMRGLHPIITLFLLAIAGISALRSWKTGTMLEQQTGLESIRQLPWKRFEDLLGEAYRRQGYKVEETLGGGADGGVDLLLGRDGTVTVVQCKRWKGKPVPVQTVRELYGILHDRGASSAKVVATTSFTAEAISFAKGKPIELVDAEGVLQLIRSVQKSGNRRTCGARTNHSCPRLSEV